MIVLVLHACYPGRNGHGSEVRVVADHVLRYVVDQGATVLVFTDDEVRVRETPDEIDALLADSVARVVRAPGDRIDPVDVLEEAAEGLAILCDIARDRGEDDAEWAVVRDRARACLAQHRRSA